MNVSEDKSIVNCNHINNYQTIYFKNIFNILLTCHIYPNLKIRVFPQCTTTSKSIIEVTYELAMRISNQTSINRNPWRLFMRSIDVNLVMIMRWRCPRYLNATSYGMRLRIHTRSGRGDNETSLVLNQEKMIANHRLLIEHQILTFNASFHHKF